MNRHSRFNSFACSFGLAKKALQKDHRDIVPGTLRGRKPDGDWLTVEILRTERVPVAMADALTTFVSSTLGNQWVSSRQSVSYTHLTLPTIYSV